MESFRKLGISEPILKSLEDEKFECPTEIQEKSIPLILDGEDIIARSATGSGKTLAFATGILQGSKQGNGVQALILTPTRELAEQVAQAFRTFSKYKKLKIIAVYGGVGINPQIKDLRHANVVIATPGRLLDHIERNTIKLGMVKTLVIDEADQMFDMGFKPDVERIISHCPMERQTLLFSATISNEVTKLARNHMHEPQRISAGEYIDPSKLEQVYYRVTDEMKFSLLVHLLKHETSNLGMVFCNTKRVTDKVTKNLNRNGVDAMAIHGGLTQSKRIHSLNLFHSGKASVLVCTDVAARGLDIRGVSHVYNYDIPKESKQYIHRIGRTARAGADGMAINIISGKDQSNFSNVLKHNDVTITAEKMPVIDTVVIGTPNKGGRKPDRSGRKPERSGNRPNRNRNKPERSGNKPNRSGSKPDKSGKKPERSSGNKKPAVRKPPQRMRRKSSVF